MDKINDIFPVDRPFTDMCEKGTATNNEKSWVREDKKTPTSGNKRVDGSSSAGINDTRTGERISNYCQIMTSTVRVSNRASNVDTVGGEDELLRQLMNRQEEVRNDAESAYVSGNIAIAGDGDSVAGQLAGVGGWIGTGQSATNTDRGITTGADPVLSGDPGGFPTTAAVAGVKRALSELIVKNMMRAAYKKGGQPTVMMSTPEAIEVFSDYLFTSSARVATIQTDVEQGNRTNNESGGGRASGGVVAQGSVNVFVTNFGVLNLVPNRFQEEVSAGVSNIYLLDPRLWEIAFLQGYETEALAKDGLAKNREISVDVTLCSLNEEGNSVIADIDTTLVGVA